MTIAGFIGLGQIGRPMASRLPDPVVFDVRAEATEGFANIASSISEVAERADVISVMVLNDAQVRDVVGELISGARPGAVIAIHSTISPRTAEDLAADAGEVHVVDAPVVGGAIGAGRGTLGVMVGGAREAFDRCREVFSSFATLVLHFGPVGSGTKAKLANNLVAFSAMSAALEAQRLAEAAGIDLVALGKVVRHGDSVTGGPGAIMFRDRTGPVASDDPMRDILVHTFELGEKDLSLALELGEELGVELPVARLALDTLATGLGVPHE